jgi:beta-phosphoglucomutase-like phosphatase (HAD superfamily)
MLWRILRAHGAAPWQGVRTFQLLAAYRRAQEECRREQREPADLYERQIAQACAACGASEPDIRAIVERWMEREPLDLVAGHVRSGARELMREARERGMRIGVVSDYPAGAKLKAMGLADYQDVVVCAQDSDVGWFKPHPAGICVALKRLDIEPEYALYVGDRPDVDAPAARAAGVACVIIGSKAKAPGDWLAAQDFSELHAHLFG